MPTPRRVSPRDALMRWLAQLHYNAIRNIETSHVSVTRTDNSKQLRGVPLADDLVLTRKRAFYRILGKKALPITVEDVVASYHLDEMQVKYREAAEAWKSEQRRIRNRRAS